MSDQASQAYAFSTWKDKLLVALAAEDALAPSGQFDLAQIAREHQPEFKSGWITKAFGIFERRGWIHGTQTISHEIDGGLMCILSGEGLVEAERLGFHDRQVVSRVPASDRFVDLNDNAALRDETVKALDQLADALVHQAPNDLFATAEDRMAVVSEVRSLADQMKQPVIRIGVLAGVISVPGILWFLAKEAVGGVVGSYAMIAIELIKGFF